MRTLVALLPHLALCSTSPHGTLAAGHLHAPGSVGKVYVDYNVFAPEGGGAAPQIVAEQLASITGSALRCDRRATRLFVPSDTRHAREVGTEKAPWDVKY